MSNFETWWEREGQEFLYALNTTTDDDIKLVAEVAWKNGAYCAEQAEQEPVAIVDEVATKLDGTPIFNGVGKVQVGDKLYTAPPQREWVSLTDDELAKALGWEFGQPMYEWVMALGRAAILADREKNS